MALRPNIPLSSRPTYIRHLRYALLHAISFELTLEVSKFIARKDLGVSDQELSLILSAPFLGMILAMFMPFFIRGERKINFVRTVVTITYAPMLILGVVRDATLAGWLSSTWWFTGLFCFAFLFQPMSVPAISAIMKANYPDNRRSSIFAAVLTRQLLVMFVCRIALGQCLKYFPDAYSFLTPVGALFVFIGLTQLSKMRVRDEPRVLPEDAKIEGGKKPSVRMVLSDWASRVKNIGLRFSFYPAAGTTGRELFSWRKAYKVLKADRAFLKYELAFSLGGGANLLGIPLYFLYFTDVLDVSIDVYNLMTALQPLVVVLTIGWWGRLFDMRQSPIWQRMVLNTIWIIPPIGFLLSSFGIGRFSPLVVGEIGRGVSFSGGHLNWTLGGLRFAKPHQGATYSSIHLFLCGVRGLIGIPLGMLMFNYFTGGVAIGPAAEIFFPTMFSVVALLTLLSTVWLFSLERQYGKRFLVPEEKIEKSKDEIQNPKQIGGGCEQPAMVRRSSRGVE